jgi:hypothetical protein
VGASKVWSASNIPYTALETICDEKSRALAALALAPLLLTFVSVKDKPPYKFGKSNPDTSQQTKVSLDKCIF